MEKVIFDTNAYRYLVTNCKFNEIDKLMEKIKNREKKRNIEALISPIVAKELLAHIANKKDPHFEKCLKAIKAMYLHSGNDENYKMLASPELLISKAFFNEVLDAKEETNKAIGQMLFHFSKNPSSYVFTKFQHNLNRNRDHIIDSENNFAIVMKQFVDIKDPLANGWQIFKDNEIKRKEVLKEIRSEEVSIQIAMGHIFTVYSLLVLSGKIPYMSNEELVKRAKSLVENYPEPIALYKVVMENMVNSEFNLFENSRANFVWDIHLMFNVGKHSIGNENLYFVTSDKAMIKAAIEENAKYTILTFDEYLDYLSR